MSDYFRIVDLAALHSHIVLSDNIHGEINPPEPSLFQARHLSTGERVLAITSGRLYAIEGKIWKKTKYSEVLRAREASLEEKDGEFYLSTTNNIVILKRYLPNADAQESAEREIGTLQHLQSQHPHPNLLPLIEAFEIVEKDHPSGDSDDNGKNASCGKFSISPPCTPSLCMVLPPCDSTLLDHLAFIKGDGKTLPRSHAQSILRQLVEVLLHLQSLGIAHGDICTQNILLQLPKDEDMEFIDTDGPPPHVYLIDFGTAVHLRRHGQPVTLHDRVFNAPTDHTRFQCPDHCFLKRRPFMPFKDVFASPETLDPSRRDYEDITYFHPMLADEWSLGLVFFALLTGPTDLFTSPPKKNKIFQYIAQHGLEALLYNWKTEGQLSLKEDEQDLLVKMLQFDPLLRPPLEDILAHPYLSSAATSADA